MALQAWRGTRPSKLFAIYLVTMILIGLGLLTITSGGFSLAAMIAEAGRRFSICDKSLGGVGGNEGLGLGPGGFVSN